jgi:hypothetical protein
MFNRLVKIWIYFFHTLLILLLLFQTNGCYCSLIRHGIQARIAMVCSMTQDWCNAVTGTYSVIDMLSHNMTKFHEFYGIIIMYKPIW